MANLAEESCGSSTTTVEKMSDISTPPDVPELHLATIEARLPIPDNASSSKDRRLVFFSKLTELEESSRLQSSGEDVMSDLTSHFPTHDLVVPQYSGSMNGESDTE
ncbi:hypothetical protein Tco_0266621 [Tanacetum coccineum]